MTLAVLENDTEIRQGRTNYANPQSSIFFFRSYTYIFNKQAFCTLQNLEFFLLIF